MQFQTYIPHLALAEHVRFYWSLEGDAMVDAENEKILPDGCPELIFHYGDLYRKKLTEQFTLQPRSFIHGQLTRFIELAPSGRTGFISIRFEPGGLAAFLPFNISSLNEENISVDDIWPNAGRDLQERIINASTNTERIHLIEAFLLSKLRPVPQTKLLQNAVRYISAARGNISITELASHASRSCRQLERDFTSGIGLSPKLFARIVRFQHSLQMFSKPVKLTGISTDAGYFDQSHFIRDFKEFSGMSPREYLSSKALQGQELIQGR